MGVDVDPVDELVRFSASANGAGGVQDLITVTYLDPAVAIETGRQLIRSGEEILRAQATRGMAELERGALRG